MSDDPRRDLELEAAWQGVSAAFAALGRVFLCLDARLRVLHASVVLDDLLGTGAAAAAAGRPVAELLGEELFGAGGVLVEALAAGQRREGWRAQLRLDDREQRLVSLSAAPFPRQLFASCDERVAYVVVVRPAEEERDSGLGAPLAMSGLIARSLAMQRIFALVENLSHSEATVLITGESGTGKELVARALHAHSPRRSGPFVAVNSAALPTGLLESEMFGHVRGAFTGSVRDRVGRFELASEGTIFLDEVGDLPAPLQAKLLRVLQDGSFERLGENKTRVSRARVMAATHVDLMRAVRAGSFRDDLYYRLRVVPIEIPPLRERREDIEPLARALLARAGARHGRSLQLSPDTLRVFLKHDWPGNVRELENVLEYALAVCRSQTVLPEDLPPLAPLAAAVRGAEATPVSDAPPHLPPDDVAELRRVMERHRWRRAAAAQELGISRSTLWRRLRESGLS